MLELTIGSRFYYKEQLCEVKKGSCSDNCVFNGTEKCCKQLKCRSTNRQDKIDVCFNKVDEDYVLQDSIGKITELLPDNKLIEYDGSDYLTSIIIQTIQYIKKVPVPYFTTKRDGNHINIIAIKIAMDEIIININDVILFDKNNNIMKIFRGTRIIKNIVFTPSDNLLFDLLRFS